LPFFNKYIEIRSGSSTGQLLQKKWPETQLWDTGLYTTEESSLVLESMNSNDKWGVGIPLSPSETKPFYQELSPSLFNILNPNMKHYHEDICIIISIREGIKIRGNGSVQLKSCRLRIHSEHENEIQKKATALLYKEPRMHTILDQVLVNKNDVNLQSLTETKFDLGTTFHGKCAYLLACIRSAANPSATNGGLSTFVNPGDDFLIDVVEGNQSVLGSGQALKYKELSKDIFASHCPSNMSKYQKIIFVLFCDNIIGAQSQVDGYMYFETNHDISLALTPPAVGQNEIQTVTFSQTNNAGTYMLGYKGQYTNPLPYNTAAANMAIAFNNLNTVAEEGLQVTFNQAVSAGTSITATFSPQRPVAAHSSGNYSNLISCIPVTLNTSGTQEGTASVILTQYGKQGWTNGNYRIDVFGFFYRNVAEEHGQLKLVN
jgi:hypothetical protein